MCLTSMCDIHPSSVIIHNGGRLLGCVPPRCITMDGNHMVTAAEINENRKENYGINTCLPFSIQDVNR